MVEIRFRRQSVGSQVFEELPAMGAFLLLGVQTYAIGGGERSFHHVGDGDVQASGGGLKPCPILFIDPHR